MPELPEVQTTVDGLNQTVRGLKVIDVWTNYESKHYTGKESIKDSSYFNEFKKKIIGANITRIDRRAKNILIRTNKDLTILVHMKMTGHLLYGTYEMSKDQEHERDPWKPADTNSNALKDPFNRHIRLVFSLSNKKHLVLSDMRKFAKVILSDTESIDKSLHLRHLGPEPLEETFTYEVFKNQISKKPKGKIKTVLMDQSVVSGVGNIYSDEALWLAGINPEESVQNIPEKLLKSLYKNVKEVLRKGIDFGGDSMSDYRNIYGEQGKFQAHHNAYRKTGKVCTKKGCKGTITRKVIGERSAHFCSIHQKRI